VARMVHRREKQMAAEKVEEEALVHEIEAQLQHTATHEAEEGREVRAEAREKSRRYSPAPRATSMPVSGGATPSGYMLASIHQAGHGAAQAAAALQAIPLARKVGLFYISISSFIYSFINLFMYSFISLFHLLTTR